MFILDSRANRKHKAPSTKLNVYAILVFKQDYTDEY